jgi:hypothetical protein
VGGAAMFLFVSGEGLKEEGVPAGAAPKSPPPPPNPPAAGEAAPKVGVAAAPNVGVPVDAPKGCGDWRTMEGKGQR